jgi:hypothetical protein
MLGSWTIDGVQGAQHGFSESCVTPLILQTTFWGPLIAIIKGTAFLGTYCYRVSFGWYSSRVGKGRLGLVSPSPFGDGSSGHLFFAK